MLFYVISFEFNFAKIGIFFRTYNIFIEKN